MEYDFILSLYTEDDLTPDQMHALQLAGEKMIEDLGYEWSAGHIRPVFDPPE